ncbi:MAG: hypothetical protein AVDCRST_MAG69-2037, partial [uncultured Solirubrobacteraceae bacterium]
EPPRSPRHLARRGMRLLHRRPRSVACAGVRVARSGARRGRRQRSRGPRPRPGRRGGDGAGPRAGAPRCAHDARRRGGIGSPGGLRRRGRVRPRTRLRARPRPDADHAAPARRRRPSGLPRVDSSPSAAGREAGDRTGAGRRALRAGRRHAARPRRRRARRALVPVPTRRGAALRRLPRAGAPARHAALRRHAELRAGPHPPRRDRAGGCRAGRDRDRLHARAAALHPGDQPPCRLGGGGAPCL